MSNFHPLEVVGRGSETQLANESKFKLFNLALEGFNLVIIFKVHFSVYLYIYLSDYFILS